MAYSSQTDRANLPSERAEELHRPVQRKRESRRRKNEQRGQKRIRLPQLHVGTHRGNPSGNCHGRFQVYPEQQRVRVRHGRDEVRIPFSVPLTQTFSSSGESLLISQCACTVRVIIGVT